MRILSFFILFFITTNLTYAQYCPPLVGKLGNDNKFHITAGYGITSTYGDVSENEEFGSAATILIDYQVKRGFLVGLESQFGSLISGSTQNNNVMQSHNNFFAGGFRITFSPYSFFSSKKILTSYSSAVLESFYIATGSLYVINSYDYVYRDLNDTKTYGPVSGRDENGNYVFRDRTRTLILPTLNAGTVFPLKSNTSVSGSFLSLVLNAQFNFGWNDLLDGYVPYNTDGTLHQGKNDVYNYYSLGLRYSF